MLLALALAAGLIAAGCGGDDDETTTTSSTTTAAGTTGATGATGAAGSDSEFAGQVNTICSEVDKKINAGPQSGSEEAFVTDTFIPAVEDGLAELGQLTPPEADADAYQAFLDEGNEALDSVKSDPSSLGPDTFKEFDKKADELGFGDCGD